MTPTNTCLDAETLAAWVDGGLSRNDAAMAEAHVSSCPRCQAIAGLIVKTTPVTIVNPPWWRARAGWLIPVATGVTAVGVLMIAPANPTPTPPPPAAMAQREPARDAIAPAAPTAAPPPAEPGRVPQDPGQRQVLKQEKKEVDRFRALAKDETPQLRAEKREEKQRDARANTSAAAAAPAAAPSAATAPPAAVLGRTAGEQAARQSVAPSAAKEAASPDGALHWRISDRGVLERSSDGRTTWTAVNIGITATFTTVQAPEPRTAIVTTTDGRQFRTTDAGATWQAVSK